MIDRSFIAGLEGKDILTGYVPNPEGSRSGVTIVSGVTWATSAIAYGSGGGSTDSLGAPTTAANDNFVCNTALGYWQLVPGAARQR